jgi:hypothetical protein
MPNLNFAEAFELLLEQKILWMSRRDSAGFKNRFDGALKQYYTRGISELTRAIGKFGVPKVPKMLMAIV